MHYDDHMMGGWNGDGPWQWFLMFGMMTFFILISVFAARYLIKEWHENGRTDRPIDVLKRRYVSGEIDKKEYEDKLKDIK